MSKTLIVRHLPNALSEDEKKSFFRHFGAENVRCMSSVGPLKHVAFATFNHEDEAKAALNKLHQLEVLGNRLIVEYAKDKSVHLFPSLDDKLSSKAEKEILKPDSGKQDVKSESEQMLTFFKSIHSSVNGTEYGYPISPLLTYCYPPATPFIVNNIAQTLMSVPKFYVQVLHLMNKMNLPTPFTASLAQPFIPPVYYDTIIRTHPEEYTLGEKMDIVESEIESDEETETNRQVFTKEISFNLRSYENQNASVPVMRKKKTRLGKRPRIDQLIPTQKSCIDKPVNKPLDASDVFELNDSSLTQKKIEINVSCEVDLEKETDDHNVDIQEGGFGKIQPVVEAEKSSDEHESENNLKPLENYITKKELKQNRISEEEMKKLSIFRKYEPGDPTTRLYLKNLSKQVTEKDILFVYGRYINWNSMEEKNIFDIRLMKEGRMKGQSFVTLPNENVSKIALAETNGYIFYGKPVVVQFARSAKPKETKK
ncbi:RNA-binding protein 40 [Nymphon striatum]|nr:RNA-binding protein 40 [Nymphon striatum]